MEPLDNVPLRDPTHLFDAPLYLENGRAAFWPDLYKDHTDNAIWRVVGDTCDMDHWTFESGQIVIDKAGNGGLNLVALHIAAYMQREQTSLHSKPRYNPSSFSLLQLCMVARETDINGRVFGLMSARRRRNGLLVQTQWR